MTELDRIAKDGFRIPDRGGRLIDSGLLSLKIALKSYFSTYQSMKYSLHVFKPNSDLEQDEIDFQHPNGLTREEYVEFCRNADVLIHDAQYTDEEYKIKRGWGHSTYTSATQLAIEAGVKEFCIFHHDPDRTDDDLDRHVEYCNTIVQKEGSSMKCYAAKEGMEITI